jgi:hypothetical protein
MLEHLVAKANHEVSTGKSQKTTYLITVMCTWFNWMSARDVQSCYPFIGCYGHCKQLSKFEYADRMINLMLAVVRAPLPDEQALENSKVAVQTKRWYSLVNLAIMAIHRISFGMGCSLSASKGIERVSDLMNSTKDDLRDVLKYRAGPMVEIFAKYVFVHETDISMEDILSGTSMGLSDIGPG